jgi:hypothetical protein
VGLDFLGEEVTQLLVQLRGQRRQVAGGGIAPGLFGPTRSGDYGRDRRMIQTPAECQLRQGRIGRHQGSELFY